MKKQRVVLRGFDEPDRASASQLLSAAGYSVVSTVTASEIVAVGPLGWTAEGNLSTDRCTAVVPWDELRRLIVADRSQPASGSAGRRPVIEYRGDHAQVVGVPVAISPEHLAPSSSAEQFSRICLDRPFLEVLRAVALGVAYGFPTALEGVTAASKTTVVLWLAYKLGYRVVRLNMNGQTDTTELIGRYVPATGAEAKWDLASLIRLKNHLKPATVNLIQSAMTEGRPLDWAESAVISAAEGIPLARWCFHEGVIPQSLRNGWWVLLDELNLGESAVLERLNPVLEMPPSLLLSEGDGTQFGGVGGIAIHPSFRLFATLNPSDYAGRNVLSPAFKDRFVNWHQARTPGEREYLEQLRFLVYGIQPEVVMDQHVFQGETVSPVHGCLQRDKDIDSMLAALACCQASLSSATSSKRNSAYAFTRRSLNALMDLWASRITVDPTSNLRKVLGDCLTDLYWNRISEPGDRKAAMGLAEASGLPIN